MKKKYKIQIVGALSVVVIGVVAWLGMAQESPGVVTPPQAVVPEAAVMPVVTLEDGTYLVVPDASSVAWSAGKSNVAKYVNTGSFAVQTGAATVNAGGISGTFTIDMNSLAVLSLGGGDAGQESALEAHLKSDAFFDVAKFPMATFTIEEVVPKVVPNSAQTSYVAKGTLSMKGVAQNITFPLAVETISSDTARAMGKFSIDRTLWGITFGSGTVAGNVADQIIDDAVTIEFAVTMRKQ